MSKSALLEVIHALIWKFRSHEHEYRRGGDVEIADVLAKVLDALEAAALSGWSFCPRCPMQWIGPYTDCPGCQAQAAMKAVSDLSQETPAPPDAALRLRYEEYRQAVATLGADHQSVADRKAAFEIRERFVTDMAAGMLDSVFFGAVVPMSEWSIQQTGEMLKAHVEEKR